MASGRRRWPTFRRTAKAGDPGAGTGAGTGAVALLTFLTREGCTLCAQARPVVERTAREAGVPVEVLDIDADPALRTWSDHVPVILLDGAEHSRWWVDEPALRKALAGR